MIQHHVGRLLVLLLNVRKKIVDSVATNLLGVDASFINVAMAVSLII